MIVLSVVLVIIAAVLLIVGIVTQGVVVIYLSIAASAAAALLLFLGVRGSRAIGEAAETTGPVGPAGPSPRPTPGVADPAADDELHDGTAIAGALSTPVMVVSGRPRYHRAGCRFISGRDDAEEIPVEEAREVGFTPCGVCKPDEATWVGEGGLLDDEGDPPQEAPILPAVSAFDTGDTVDAGDAGLPGADAVVVMPDRGKFHRAACRFVRGVEGTGTLSRADAQAQGYTACGVCKP
ncbi:MAG TPA: hypothetical protein VGN54_14410 [Mycobacteriales bacterium]|nr:hypothetical protein [Mycobacteriales bacterium]